MRWIVAPLLALSLSACAGSSEKIHAALEAASDAAAIADESLVVSKDAYEGFCSMRPNSRYCTGELATKIRSILAAGPLTVGQIKALIEVAK